MYNDSFWNNFSNRASDDNCWRVTREMKNCPLSKKENIAVSKTVRDKVSRLNAGFPNYEWMLYAIVKDRLDENNNVKEMYIEDVVIPKQVISHAAVRPLDFPIINNIRGTIHSHNTMGAFFSGQDHNHLMGNHDVTIVVSGENWKASTRETAPCGVYINMDCNMFLLDKDEIENLPKITLIDKILNIFKYKEKAEEIEPVDSFGIEMKNIMTDIQFEEIQRKQEEERRAKIREQMEKDRIAREAEKATIVVTTDPPKEVTVALASPEAKTIEEHPVNSNILTNILAWIIDIPFKIYDTFNKKQKGT